MRKVCATTMLPVFVLAAITTSGQVTTTTSTNKQQGTKAASQPAEFTITYDTAFKSWKLIASIEVEPGRIVSDRLDNIYCIMRRYANIPAQRLYRIDHDTLVDETPGIKGIEGAYAVWLDSENDVVLETKDHTPGNYRFKYYLHKNAKWIAVLSDDSIKALTDLSLNRARIKKYVKPPAGESGELLYPRGRNLILRRDGSNPNKGILLEYRNNKWESISNFYWGENWLPLKLYPENVVVSGKSLYYVDSRGVWKNDGTVAYEVTARRVYNNREVPFFGEEKDKAEALAALGDYLGIYEKNGKIGLRRKDGKIITHPVFTRITMEKSPKVELAKEVNKYLYHLTGDGMDVYCLYSCTDSNWLRGYIEDKELCRACNGYGRIIKETYERDRELVQSTTTQKGSTSYERVWNADCKCYTGVRSGNNQSTTTTNSYYKDNGKKLVEKDLGSCTKCDNGKRNLTVKMHVYKYDEKTGKYVHEMYEYAEKFLPVKK